MLMLCVCVCVCVCVRRALLLGLASNPNLKEVTLDISCCEVRVRISPAQGHSQATNPVSVSVSRFFVANQRKGK